MPIGLKRIVLSLFVLFLFTVMGFTGCNYQKSHVQPDKPFPASTGRMAVIGFRAALNEGQEAGMVSSPISGAVFMAEPVPEAVVLQMNDFLYNQLVKKEGYDLISPPQVEDAFPDLLSDGKYNPGDMTLIQQVGKAFSADTVLLGYLYRWREREGTKYSVNQPASVAFDLYLIESESGDILWKGGFDKTQQSLMENLLDFSFFWKGKGTWMTARQLAELGLTKMLEARKQQSAADGSSLSRNGFPAKKQLDLGG